MEARASGVRPGNDEKSRVDDDDDHAATPMSIPPRQRRALWSRGYVTPWCSVDHDGDKDQQQCRWEGSAAAIQMSSRSRLGCLLP